MAESDGPCIIELGLIQGSQRYLTCENQMHESRSTSGMHVQLSPVGGGRRLGINQKEHTN